MKRIDEIFSMAQKDISDEEFQKIQREEWYNFAERVFWDISSYTRAFLRSVEFTPNPDGSADVKDVVIGAEYKPYKVLKVVRNIYDLGGKKSNGAEAREYSYQAIDNAQRSEYAFPVNRTELFNNSFQATRLTDESLILSFSSPFKRSEICRISLLHGSEDVPVHWRHTQDILVPDYMIDAARFGLLQKALERLSMQSSNNEYMNRLARAEQLYAKSAQKLKSYIVNLKDENSFPQGQPMVWLPE